MISYIAQKIKFDYNITLYDLLNKENYFYLFKLFFSEEFKRHAYHVDKYIEEIIAYLRAKHLNNRKSISFLFLCI
jgi:hypothetical protein